MTTKTKCPTCGHEYIRGHNAIHDCTGHLLEQLAVARAALKPFADHFDQEDYCVSNTLTDPAVWEKYMDDGRCHEDISNGDIRRAHEAYNKLAGSKDDDS